MKFDGIPVFVPNDIPVEVKDFYVSYNDRDVSIYGHDTTALVLEKPLKFLILNGNHSEEYKEIVAKGGGYQECLAYFKENLDQKSKYSENWDETVIFKDGSFVAVKDSVI